MKPVIREFEIKGEPINGAYRLGMLPAGHTVWSWHTGFVNGKPAVTFIGADADKPPQSGQKD
jgi:hypothetical protein